MPHYLSTDRYCSVAMAGACRRRRMQPGIRNGVYFHGGHIGGILRTRHQSRTRQPSVSTAVPFVPTAGYDGLPSCPEAKLSLSTYVERSLERMTPMAAACEAVLQRNGCPRGMLSGSIFRQFQQICYPEGRIPKSGSTWMLEKLFAITPCQSMIT